MELKPAGNTKSKDRGSSRTGPKAALFSGLQPLSVEGPLMCERLQELAGSDKCCARVMPDSEGNSPHSGRVRSPPADRNKGCL